MKENKSISSKQIKALVVTIVIGARILSLPSKLARAQGNDGWISIILAGLLTVLPLIVINKIFQLYPDKDFFQIGEEVFGRWIFNTILIIYLIHFIILAALVTRHLAEIIRAFLLITTPIEVIIISFIISSSYLARSDMHIIGRSSYHIYPIVIGFLILLGLISLTEIDFTNLLPVFQSDVKVLPKSIGITFFSYAGFEILLFFLPFAENRRESLKSSLKGLAIVGIIYTGIFIVTLGQYGSKQLQRQTFPTLSFIKEIDLPGFFIENLDGFVIAVWILIIFATMGAYYYSAGKVLACLSATKNHDIFILPLLPIIYIISLLPENIVTLEEKLGNAVNYTGIIVILLVPAIIYSIGYFKTRRVKN